MDEKTPAAVAQPKNEPRPANVVDRAKEYVADLQAEMRRVTWPSWKQVRATTTVVVVLLLRG
jgi:preprotein translocase subunit SecE